MVLTAALETSPPPMKMSALPSLRPAPANRLMSPARPSELPPEATWISPVLDIADAPLLIATEPPTILADSACSWSAPVFCSALDVPDESVTEPATSPDPALRLTSPVGPVTLEPTVRDTSPAAAVSVDPMLRAMEPLLLSAESPVKRFTSPDVSTELLEAMVTPPLAETALAPLDTSTFPPAEPAETPPFRIKSPPSANPALLLPPLMRALPPAPALEPAVKLTSPPTLPAPAAMLTAPPLVPRPAEASMRTSPPCAPAPELILRMPPTDASVEVVSPAETTTLAPLVFAVSPERTSIAPACCSDDPVVNSTDPVEYCAAPVLTFTSPE